MLIDPLHKLINLKTEFYMQIIKHHYIYLDNKYLSRLY